jgi:hypothetical protein
MYFDFMYGIYADTREKTNRESARISQAFGLLSESDLLILTFAIQLHCLAHPLSGPFGQILSAPQRLPIIIPLNISHFALFR